MVGVSTRMIVESAVRAGNEVVAVDFFGDRDQVRLAETYALGRDLGLRLTAANLGVAARRIAAEAVMYGANLENHPEVVDDLSRQGKLLGNDARSLSEVRDWAVLQRFSRSAGIAFPTTLLAGEEGQARRGGQWLRKRVRSGGGHGVRPWNGRRVDRAHVVQAWITGQPASVAFVADGRTSRVIGIAEQLLGWRELGATGFTWCGNVVPLELSAADYSHLVSQVSDMASQLTRRFRLRGLNGLDIVLRREANGVLRPYLVEVNPRYTASLELVERAYGVNAFALHLAAANGHLPPTSLAERPPGGFFAKGVLYAKETFTVGDTERWLAEGVRDVPFAGQSIAAGHPVCTVLASGKDRSACLADLAERASAVYANIGDMRKERCGRTIHADNWAHA